MKFIGGAVSLVVVGFLGTVWSGYVLSVMWGWFIVSVFALPQLSVNSAIGVTMICAYLSKSLSTKKDERSFIEQLSALAVTGTLRPLIALGCGWIVTLFA